MNTDHYDNFFFVVIFILSTKIHIHAHDSNDMCVTRPFPSSVQCIQHSVYIYTSDTRVYTPYTKCTV